MKKKLISLLLAAVMVLSMVPFVSLAAIASSSSTVTGGNGNQLDDKNKVTYDSKWYDSSATDLYIWDESDFLAYGLQIQNAGASGKSYKNQVIHIMNDLDFSDLDLATFATAKFSAGASSENWFNVIFISRNMCGIIDGHGHSITGLEFATDSNARTKGGLLGGILYPCGTLNEKYGVNAGVFNLTVSGKMTNLHDQYNGGLFATTTSVSGAKVAFKNVVVDIEMESSANTIGGFIGYVNKTDASFDNCIVKGTISGNLQLGGFVGYSYGANKLSFTNCLSTVAISSDGAADYNNINIAGLVGSSDCDLSIDRSAFYGTVAASNATGNGKVSALVGSAAPAATCDFQETCKVSISNSIAGGTINGTTSLGNSGAVIGVVGSRTKGGATLSNVICDVTPAGALTSVKHYGSINANITQSVSNIENVDVSTGYTANLVGENADLSPYFTATPAYYPIPYGVAKYYSADINGADAIGTSTSIEGYQTTDYVDSKCDLRLIGLVHGEKTAYDAVGFEFVIVNEAGVTRTNVVDGKAPAITNVYTSVLEPDIDTETGKQKTDPETGDKLYVSTSAETLGGDYIFVTTISPMVANKGIVTIIVKSFHDIDGVRAYDDVMVINFDTTVNS